MLVDSNILIYSINTLSPKHKKAQDFLQNNIGTLEITHQNILETLRVLTHPKYPSPMKMKDALKAIENILDACEVISPNHKTHFVTLELIGKYNLSSDKVFDAYLVATALCNDITTIATDNTKDMGKFLEITVTNPFDNDS